MSNNELDSMISDLDKKYGILQEDKECKNKIKNNKLIKQS